MAPPTKSKAPRGKRGAADVAEKGAKKVKIDDDGEILAPIGECIWTELEGRSAQSERRLISIPLHGLYLSDAFEKQIHTRKSASRGRTGDIASPMHTSSRDGREALL